MSVLTSLRRTPYQTTAAFSVLLFTLLLAGVLFVALTFLQGLLRYVETRPQVIVYFQPKASEAQIFAVRDSLMSTGKVASVKYISKQEAYGIYKELTKDNPLLLEMTSADILPASIEIYAKEPSYLAQLADSVRNQAGVDEVQFQKDIVDRLLNLTNILRQTTVIFFSYLLFMSVVVLTTTTSFKIALKKDEIELLKLLGATNMYIRKPFIKESMFLGLSAATGASIILFGILFYINGYLRSYLSGIPDLSVNVLGLPIPVWPFNPFFFLLTLAFTSLFGTIIALIASFAATNRYLKS